MILRRIAAILFLPVMLGFGSGVRVGCDQSPAGPISMKLPPFSLNIRPSWTTNIVPGSTNFGFVTVGFTGRSWTTLLFSVPR